MPTMQENLQTQLDALGVQLATLNGQKAGYSIDGQSVDRSQQGQNIIAEMERIRELIIQLDGPFEYEIQGG